ncbi:hypothetical protein [Kaarinaea lacus]
MSIARKAKTLSLVFLISTSVWVQAEEAIDASDPTKIYSYVGPGYKYTEYSNGDHLQELRVVGNLGLSDSDMVMFELGYGKYSGTVLPGEDDAGLTNMRARWFHLFKMDPSVTSGYRGWATQVDLQGEGSVKGTKGSNTLAIGALPAYGINAEWAFYLPINYVSTWGHNFDKHQGSGISVAPMAAYAPAKGPWPGFFLQIWPSYTRYFSGNLDGEGGANLDLTLGWSPATKVVATATLQQNFDKDLNLYNPSTGSSGANDWNIFASASWYF